MTIKQQRVSDYLEGRIQVYRYCTAVVFVLGLLAGAGVLCGGLPLLSPEFPHRYQDLTKIVLCFAISLSGILAAAVYRNQIAYIMERRDRILLNPDSRPAFAKPAREQCILEVQVLFGMMAVLAVVVCCIDYPVPGLPPILDLPPLRLALLGGFFIFCWVSTRLEKNNIAASFNSVEDFLRRHQKQARIREYKQPLAPVGWVSGNVLGEEIPDAVQQHQIRNKQLPIASGQ